MADAEALGGATDGPAGEGAGDPLAALPVQATTRTARAASEAGSVMVGMVAGRMMRLSGSESWPEAAKGLTARVCSPLWRPEDVSSRGGLERVYQDRSLTCRDCAEEFSFSAGEQAFFAGKGLTNDPQRCPSCRAVAKRARSSDGPREFHAALCGACGGQAVVPFAPRNDRPVYCSACFDKVRAGTLSASATA